MCKIQMRVSFIFFVLFFVKQESFYFTFSAQSERKSFNCLLGIVKKQKQGDVWSSNSLSGYFPIPKLEDQPFV